MIRRPPRSTRTDTLFPYTTLFRSLPGADLAVLFTHQEGYSTMCGHATIALGRWAVDSGRVAMMAGRAAFGLETPCGLVAVEVDRDGGDARSEERRVGKECVSTCRSRWSPYH